MKGRHHIVFFLSFMFLFFFTFISASFAESQQAYEVGTANLNVRNAPSLDAEVVGHLQPGVRVEAFAEQHGWVKIYYYGEFSWVALQYLSLLSWGGGVRMYVNDEKIEHAS